MSLIIGILAKDSLVIASESEESAGYLAKRHLYKLERFAGGDWALVVGGVGHGFTIDNATQRLGEILAEKEHLTKEELRDAIDRVLNLVYKKYINPDPKHEGIWLIGGASIGDELLLFQTEKRIVKLPADPCVCAGYGYDAAIYWLDRIDCLEMDWEHAAAAAGFVMAQVKESVKHCSGNSEMVVLQCPPSPRWRLPGRNMTQEDWNERIDVGDMVTSAIEQLQVGDAEKDFTYMDEHTETGLKRKIDNL